MWVLHFQCIRNKYSGISIYQPCNVRYPVFIVRHIWSRIKFHINNVIYFRINRSPDRRFSAFIACKSRSRHSISHMDFLAWFVWETKLKRAVYVVSVLHTSTTRGRLYVCIQPTRIYLWYIIFASPPSPMVSLQNHRPFCGCSVVCCSPFPPLSRYCRAILVCCSSPLRLYM
jgi:hypothetical protein